LNTTAKCANGASSAQKWKRRNFGERNRKKTVESAIQTAEVAVWAAKKMEILWEL